MSIPLIGQRSRGRCDKSITETHRAWVFELANRYRPLSLRQLFYRCVVNQYAVKTEAAYQALGGIVKYLRLHDLLPWHYIIDSSRTVECNSYGSANLQSHLDNFKHYDRDKFQTQPINVEVWCESDSSGSVLSDVCSEYRTTLRICKGFASLSFLHSAMTSICHTHKPTRIYYFGDYDKAGKDIEDSIWETLDILMYKYADPYPDWSFERVAVTPKQIEEWQLPTDYGKESNVELEAIEPTQLKKLCRQCIIPNIDWDRIAEQEEIEEKERQFLRNIELPDFREQQQ